MNLDEFDDPNDLGVKGASGDTASATDKVDIQRLLVEQDETNQQLMAELAKANAKIKELQQGIIANGEYRIRNGITAISNTHLSRREIHSTSKEENYSVIQHLSTMKLIDVMEDKLESVFHPNTSSATFECENKKPIAWSNEAAWRQSIDSELDESEVKLVFNEIIGKSKQIIKDSLFNKCSDITNDSGDVWTFIDTDNQTFDNATTDYVLVLANQPISYYSVGLMVQIINQRIGNRGEFVNRINRVRLQCAMTKLLKGRGFQGVVYAVVTDLKRLIIVRMTGNKDNTKLEKSKVYYGNDVRLQFLKILASRPAELGVMPSMLNEIVFTSEHDNRKECKVLLFKQLGEGSTSIVYQVQGFPNFFVKIYKESVPYQTESNVLRSLKNVKGVPQLFGYEVDAAEKTSAEGSTEESEGTAAFNKQARILCSGVGRNLTSIQDYVSHTNSLHNVCLLGMQYVEILKSIHSKGYIHRDISPNNLFVPKKHHYKDLLVSVNCAVVATSEIINNYVGTSATMCNDILTAAIDNKGYKLTPILDLESLVKSLWIMYDPDEQCQNLTGEMSDIRDFWLAEEQSSELLREWFQFARDSDYTGLKKAFKVHLPMSTKLDQRIQGFVQMFSSQRQLQPVSVFKSESSGAKK